MGGAGAETGSCFSFSGETTFRCGFNDHDGHLTKLENTNELMTSRSFFQASKTKEGVDCDGGSDLLPSDNESVNTDKPSLDRQVVTDR